MASAQSNKRAQTSQSNFSNREKGRVNRLEREEKRQRGIKALDQCTLGQFWEREWLDGPAYDSLAEVWESLGTPLIEAADRLPRSSDYVTIGRLRRFGARDYLIQTENGEYGVVDEKQSGKWRLTPLE